MAEEGEEEEKGRKKRRRTRSRRRRPRRRAAATAASGSLLPPPPKIKKKKKKKNTRRKTKRSFERRRWPGPRRWYCYSLPGPWRGRGGEKRMRSTSKRRRRRRRRQHASAFSFFLSLFLFFFSESPFGFFLKGYRRDDNDLRTAAMLRDFFARNAWRARDGKLNFSHETDRFRIKRKKNSATRLTCLSFSLSLAFPQPCPSRPPGTAGSRNR